MTIKFVSNPYHPKCRQLPTHALRILSPLGVYPCTTVVSEESVLYIGETICFSITPFNVGERRSFEFYSEVDWLTLEEIRLYASILLATRREESYTAFYPYRFPSTVFVGRPTSSKRVQRELRRALIDEHERNGWKLTVGKGIIHPPLFGGLDYDLRKAGLRLPLQRMLFSKIDITDHLMIRGLSTLLRSIMVAQHYQFMEEAINTIFISLEASFRLVLRRLTEMGYKNPTSSDAAKLVSKVFYEDSIEMKYFEEFYESRIKSFHPESRYGIYPHAPLMIDDFFHLRDSLMEVYAYLLTGFVKPELVEYAMERDQCSDIRMYGETLRQKNLRRPKFQ